MEGKPNYRLGWGTIFVLVFTALIADLVTLIPFAGDFVGPAFWVCLNVFLFTKGFGIINARRLTTSILSTVAEMIPAVQELPLITVGVIVFVVFARIEDRTGLKLTKGKAGLQSSARNVLNHEGVRSPQRPTGKEAGEDNMVDFPSQDGGSNRNPNTQPLNVDGVRKAA